MSTTKFSHGVFLILLVGTGLVGNAAPQLSTLRPSGASEAQTTYRMSRANNVIMTLSGTMPLHNWSMSAHGILGNANVTFVDHQLTSIAALTFRLPVRNLKGESAGMDSDCYHALKADTYSEIVFHLSSATIEPKKGNQYTVYAIGNLSVAGVTRTLTLAMDATVAADGSMTFAGSQSLKMSEYNIERPSRFFGAIKAGDEMMLTYNLIFDQHDHAHDN
ncbi:MAG TPA: YceI family protein [Candidatus Kapabacteria bacterium]|nr:YceI family protein [Candidatus Kapabacteria bacterium]